MVQLSIRLQDEIMPEISIRGDKSSVVRESLERYFSVLSRARKNMREIFTDNELALMADASNGIKYEAWSIPHFAEGIKDSINLDGLGEKWKVDTYTILSKLSGMDTASLFALVDSLEQYWRLVGQGEFPEHSGILL